MTIFDQKLKDKLYSEIIYHIERDEHKIVSFYNGLTDENLDLTQGFIVYLKSIKKGDKLNLKYIDRILPQIDYKPYKVSLLYPSSAEKLEELIKTVDNIRNNIDPRFLYIFSDPEKRLKYENIKSNGHIEVYTIDVEYIKSKINPQKNH